MNLGMIDAIKQELRYHALQAQEESKTLREELNTLKGRVDKVFSLLVSEPVEDEKETMPVEEVQSQIAIRWECPWTKEMRLVKGIHMPEVFMNQILTDHTRGWRNGGGPEKLSLLEDLARNVVRHYQGQTWLDLYQKAGEKHEMVDFLRYQWSASVQIMVSLHSGSGMPFRADHHIWVFGELSMEPGVWYYVMDRRLVQLAPCGKYTGEDTALQLARFLQYSGEGSKIRVGLNDVFYDFDFDAPNYGRKKVEEKTNDE